MISLGITSMGTYYNRRLEDPTVYESDRMRKDPNDRIPLRSRLLSSTVVLFAIGIQNLSCCNLKVQIWSM
jgi:hypothetical protein